MSKLISTLILFLISSNAFAQSVPDTKSNMMSFVPLILIFLIFYFLLIKPQQKKAREQKEMVNNLKIGNDVCTISGILGKIKKIDDKENLISLEIADDVTIQILKASVSHVLDSKKVAKINENTKSKGKKSKK